MATRFPLLPGSAEYGSASFPQYMSIHATAPRPVLAFDAGTTENAYWTFIAPQGLTTPLTLVVSYCMASATSGDVVLQSTIEAITDGDATDLDTASSHGFDNISAAATVPGTAGYPDQISLTLTNDDSIAAGDYCRIKVGRLASSGSDTAAGDLYFLAAEIRDSA